MGRDTVVASAGVEQSLALLLEGANEGLDNFLASPEGIALVAEGPLEDIVAALAAGYVNGVRTMMIDMGSSSAFADEIVTYLETNAWEDTVNLVRLKIADM